MCVSKGSGQNIFLSHILRCEGSENSRRRWLDITLHSSYTRHNKINIRNFKFLPHEVEERPDESAIGLSFIYQTVKLNYKAYERKEYDEFERNVRLFMKFNGENVKDLTLVDFHETMQRNCRCNSEFRAPLLE